MFLNFEQLNMFLTEQSLLNIEQIPFEQIPFEQVKLNNLFSHIGQLTLVQLNHSRED